MIRIILVGWMESTRGFVTTLPRLIVLYSDGCGIPFQMENRISWDNKFSNYVKAKWIPSSFILAVSPFIWPPSQPVKY